MKSTLLPVCLLAIVGCLRQDGRSGGGEDSGAAGPAASRAGGLPGYEGSVFCSACHPEQGRGWEGSLHARTVHEPTERERDLLSRSILCGDERPKYVLGERHARRFMVDSEREPGLHVLLPCRYDVGAGGWTHLHEADWRSLTWEGSCGACHTTGFSSDDLAFAEMGVGCESCHGAGRLHGDFRRRGGMIAFASLSAAQEVTLCASCHLQGGRSRRTGLNFAYNYEAGGDLFADYEFDWSEVDRALVRTDDPVDIHQKVLIREIAARQEGSLEGLRCTTCHSFHDMAHEKHRKAARGRYCELCHEPRGFEIKEYRQSCGVCEF